MTTDRSSSASIPTSNVSSQPTSIKILIPLSSSSNDWQAGESDCAPSSGVKWNMVELVRVGGLLNSKPRRFVVETNVLRLPGVAKTVDATRNDALGKLPVLHVMAEQAT